MSRKRGVFISHISEESTIAIALKTTIQAAFGSGFPVFVSSDSTSIKSGKRWYDEILAHLRAAKVIIILVTQRSVERRWINFEAGVGMGEQIEVIPVVASGFSKGEIGLPLNHLQARDLANAEDLHQLINDIGNICSRPPMQLKYQSLVTHLDAAGAAPRSRDVDSRLASVLDQNVIRELQAFSDGRWSWGSAKTIQSNPYRGEGWNLNRVEILLDGFDYFTFSPSLMEKYALFKNGEFARRFPEDRVRVMLRVVPVAFTDLRPLRLVVKLTRWSQIVFFQEMIRENPEIRHSCLKSALGAGDVTFPNSLSLLLIVTTEDDLVLLTQTSARAYYGTLGWACSIGEHLSQEDISPGEPMTHWVRRALQEELAVGVNEFDQANSRIMAVVFEYDLANFALVATVRLNLSSTELGERMRVRMKPDDEFANWRFCKWPELLSELRSPTVAYHKNTGIRICYAAVRRFGVDGFYERLLNPE